MSPSASAESSVHGFLFNRKNQGSPIRCPARGFLAGAVRDAVDYVQFAVPDVRVLPGLRLDAGMYYSLLAGVSRSSCAMLSFSTHQSSSPEPLRSRAFSTSRIPRKQSSSSHGGAVTDTVNGIPLGGVTERGGRDRQPGVRVVAIVWAGGSNAHGHAAPHRGDVDTAPPRCGRVEIQASGWSQGCRPRVRT